LLRIVAQSVRVSLGLRFHVHGWLSQPFAVLNCLHLAVMVHQLFSDRVLSVVRARVVHDFVTVRVLIVSWDQALQIILSEECHVLVLKVEVFPR
jgi:hypothetical protein